MRESKRLVTLGFGIPNLFKFGEVGYFSEEFIKDLGLQGLTALEIKNNLLSSGMDIDGDVIGRWSDKIGGPELMYFVNLKDNIFDKYILDLPESNTLDGTFNYVDRTMKGD